MKQSNGISFEDANSSLPEADRELTTDINARAAAAGYAPFIKAGKEPDDYKIEYKKGKPSRTCLSLELPKTNGAFDANYIISASTP